MSSKAGHQVGKFIYRGRNTGEYPQKLVTKLANLFIGEETGECPQMLVTKLANLFVGEELGECPQKLVTKLANLFIGEETLVNVLKSWSPSWQIY